MKKQNLMYKSTTITDELYSGMNAGDIEKVEAVVTMAGFVSIRFLERKGGTHVRESRLYSAKDEAEASIKK